MPKLKPEEVEHRRQEIIDAARACFLRSGFHQTTTDEICREAAITPGGLYHYFGSKEEIISAVIDDAARTVVTALSQRAKLPDLRSALREVSSFFFESMRDSGLDNVVRFDIETWAEALRNEKLAEINERAWAMRRDWLETLIDRAKNEGMYGEAVAPKALADLMMAILTGLRVCKVMWGESFDIEGAMRSLFLMHAGQLVTNGAVELPEEMAVGPAAGAA